MEKINVLLDQLKKKRKKSWGSDTINKIPKIQNPQAGSSRKAIQQTRDNTAKFTVRNFTTLR